VITIIYTNWRRSSHLKKIIASARKQTVSPIVWVVDNASNTEFEYTGDCDRLIPADNSRKCLERWEHARDVKTKFVCIMDDDLMFLDNSVLEKSIRFLDKNETVDAIGKQGVILRAPTYWESIHISIVKRHTHVDILKGRFIVTRASVILENPITNEPGAFTCDDIVFSSKLNKKIVMKGMHIKFRNLPEGNEALYASEEQKKARNTYCKLHFNV